MEHHPYETYNKSVLYNIGPAKQSEVMAELVLELQHFCLLVYCRAAGTPVSRCLACACPLYCNAASALPEQNSKNISLEVKDSRQATRVGILEVAGLCGSHSESAGLRTGLLL